MDGVSKDNAARIELPTYGQVQRMVPDDLVERLHPQETPDHLVATKLAELATSRFREEYDASRRSVYRDELGTLALLGEANALRALHAEQVGFSRYYVDLALNEATESMLKLVPEEIDARMVIAASGLGIAAVRHLRLDQREYKLRGLAFVAR